MRALIIDDSVVMRKVVERAVRQAGIELNEVLQANNGAEALEILRLPENASGGLDIILSDINMPIMDGLQFLEARQAENLAMATPVIVITTEGNVEIVKRAIGAGAKGYICKPFTSDQIRARIAPLLLAAAK
jgi:two-component system chemotaxis response regulator CheY